MKPLFKLVLRKKRAGFLLSMISLSIWIIMSGQALADESDNEPGDEFKPGFSGYIQPMVGVMSTKSNSAVGDDNEKIDSLDQDAKSETEFLPMVLWSMGYTLKSGTTQFYIGTPEQEIIEGTFLAEAGVRQKLSDGTILSAAWVPNLLYDEVWSDPFLTGRNRQETDRETQAFIVAAKSIIGTPLTLRYGFAKQEIENDRAGYFVPGLTAGDRAKLKRDSNFHLVEAQYSIPFDMGIMIIPQIGYLMGDADGDANSFKQFEGKITVEYPLGKWQLFGNVNMASSDYDEINPVFNKTREDKVYGAMLGVGYAAPFGWENIMVNIYTSFEQRDSNIKFYDSTSAMAGVGLSWMF
ncbi:MAG: DUF2860 domain-containing protein [Anaerolineales bacterium]|nr:DUF2860 domain-containing protein [Anaerolineales bacterium]